MASPQDPLFVRWLPRMLYLTALLALLVTVLGDVSAVGSFLTAIAAWLPVPMIDFFSTVVVVFLAAALERRKRVAWIIMMMGVALLACLYALTSASLMVYADELPEVGLMTAQVVVNTLILIAVGIALMVYRRWYQAQTQVGNVRRALVALLGGLTLTAAAGAIALGFTGGFAWSRLGALTGEAIGLDVISGSNPDWLLSMLGLGLTLSFLVAFWILLRSQRDSARMTFSEEKRVRELLAQGGTDSLGYFSTRRDKSVLLTEHSGITYRVELGVCLVGGDPLGEQRHWPAAAKEFVRHATTFGWVPAVISASEAGARAYQAAGLRALRIGDEAVLSVDRFNLNDLPEVRRIARRLTDLGYEVRIRRHGAIPADELRHLADLADQWRSGGEERGFSMALGRLGDPSDPDCLMVEALFPAEHEQAGTTAGLLSFAPWGADGASLDVMRRHPDADHGVTELMVAELMTRGGDVGVAKVSLNFAVFRSAFVEGAQIGAGPMKRLWRRLLLFASRWWQLESLYRSNVKYDPTWVPRLICYPDGSDLGRVGVALGIAEGFIASPRRFGRDDGAQTGYNAEQVDALRSIARPAPAAKATTRIPEQVRGRLATREAMLATGIEPYPVRVDVTAQCATAAGHVRIAGRVLGLRDHGGVIFVSLRDFSGDLQLMLERNKLGSDSIAQFRSLVRLGDQLCVAGIVGSSRTGTRTLAVGEWTIISKSLRPWPDKHHGIKDPEARVRQRYLDLAINPRQRDLLRARSAAFRAVRETLQTRGYLEVETPILQPVHGGANARPFRTHINAYHLDLYLRIAPELYLKRLLVGGAERVFEMGRNFRNEGADATHNPEFTMLEAYQAYADYNIMRDVVRDLVLAAAQAALGTTIVRGRVGGVEHEIDLAEPWRVVTITDAVASGVGEEVTADTPLATLHGYADKLGIGYDPRWGWGTMLQELYEHLAEGSTVAPTFFTDFPAETSPLTRPHRLDDRLAERWDLIVFGSELGTAYSELVDPVIQRARLTAQSLAAAGGDPEAMELDEDFLLALEHGMPPAGGLGMGLDRLVMLLTDSSIRSTIAFPLVRPRGS